MNALKRVPKTETPLTEYALFFPHNTPSCYQQSLIETTVTDMAAWRETLKFWAGNDYRPQSIQKMLDYYARLLEQPARPQDVGRPGLVVVPETAPCGTCGDAYCLRDHRYSS